jgi:hypothetical protein
MERIKDPWFSANRPFQNVEGKSDKYYLRDDPGRVVGCYSRMQYCNPDASSDRKCTELGARLPMTDSADALWQNDVQKSLFGWFIKGGDRQVYTPSSFLDGEALLASRGTEEAAFPDNQWELEFEHWFQYILASKQRAMVELAVGPTNPTIRRHYIHPNTTSKKLECRSQKFRSEAYTSFSVLGLFIILITSFFVILLSELLPWLTTRKQLKHSPFKSIEWTMNETLQLQRLAHEGIGAGTWRRACSDYPITKDDQTPATLDITNRAHPKFIPPPVIHPEKISISQEEMIFIEKRKE